MAILSPMSAANRRVLLMARNVEIKARIESVEAMWPRVVAMADSGPTEIFQDDTFFACPNGRLKLREFADGRGELIFYRRSNEAGPKSSEYTISPTATPDSLREVLTLAYGQIGRVEKQRTLFMAGRTRIHLDRVKRLGEFLELEVIMGENELAAACMSEACSLMEKLGIQPSALIECAYLDLIAGENIGGLGGSVLEGK